MTATETTTGGGLRPSPTILGHESCGYELVLISCTESCTACLRMVEDTAYEACLNDAKRAVLLQYLTADDTTVTKHEVMVTRLYEVDLTKEPF